MDRVRILFVCTFFGGRARIAENYAQQMGLEHIEAYSSGFEAGTLGGLPVRVMEEAGFNFSTTPLTTVFERYANNESFDYVITLCHETSTEKCPVFRDSVDMVYGKQAQILDWSILDFLALKGFPDEKLEGARKIRDTIKSEVYEFLSKI
ncbi:MAG: hypothetical protein P8H31_00190 [Porticoccaceae bacterium]|nr:hypothetical protein [Porticoccaceae bacterium]